MYYARRLNVDSWTYAVAVAAAPVRSLGSVGSVGVVGSSRSSGSSSCGRSGLLSDSKGAEAEDSSGESELHFCLLGKECVVVADWYKECVG